MSGRNFVSLPRPFLYVVLTLLLLVLGLPSANADHSHSPVAGLVPSLPAEPQAYAIWDDAESHRWIGESWGDDATVDWVEFAGRRVMQTNIVNGSVNWALIRTDAFPRENWEGVTAVSADVYQVGAPGTVDIKLEVRGEDFDERYASEYCRNIASGAWRNCVWQLDDTLDLSQVAHLSLVFDHLGSGSPTFYLDNLHIVKQSGAELWDDFDDGSRNWFYFGNWLNWNEQADFGLDPVTHNVTSSSSPAGAVSLQWDYQNGVDPGLTTAEIGTSQLDDITQWGIYRRLQADVHISTTAVPVSLFFWDSDAGLGFGTATRIIPAANSWQTVSWDIPWPSSFDSDSVDELKFIVNEIDSQQTGTLYIDNITLVTGEQLDPVDGHVLKFDTFDDQDPGFNDFNAPKGVLNGAYITADIVNSPVVGANGAALQLRYDLSPNSFAGYWESQWGDIDDELRTLDYTKGFQQIHMWLRGSGSSQATHNLKVELKDVSGAFESTAYRYIAIDDSDTEWREVVLDADVTNGEFWSYNGGPPDPARMKELVFVIESAFNNPAGTFYLDNIHIVVSEPPPLEGLPYIYDSFNDRNNHNDFQGDCGPLNDDYVNVNFSSAPAFGSWGYALQVDYTLAPEEFTGYWCSLWGSIDNLSQSIDFTDIFGRLNEPDKEFEQIRFKVRGSGQTAANHIVKVELKDTRKAHEYTAYRYLFIDDSDTSWREVVLDADLTNTDFWSYNDLAPDPARMKELVFVVESDLNSQGGTFYIDNIRFIDADDQPFDLSQHSDDEFLDLISKTTFLTFLDWRDEQTGLYQDLAIHSDRFSIAATGFGLTALTIGEARGWIDHAEAMAMARQTLQTLWDGQTGDPAATNGHMGFFYHFLGEDGFRKGDSELSSVDTALLLFGIISVREHFHDNAAIVQLADRIYDRVDWPWMLHDEDLFYLGWKPECNDSDYQIPAPGGGCFSNFPEDGRPLDWDIYTDEVILINLLAVGSATHPVSKDVFYAWERSLENYGGYEAVTSWNGSFFTYVFAHLWIDFAALGQDAHPDPALRVNWWENSVQAALTNRQYAVDHQDDVPCTDEEGEGNFTTYNGPVFGATAAEGPLKYEAYGFEPSKQIPPLHDGTIAPYGAGSAVMFVPQEALAALKFYFTETDNWRYRIGFADAYNIDPPDCGQPWYNHVPYGIDNGPMLLAIENYRSGFVWDTMKNNDQIQDAIIHIYADADDYYYIPLIAGWSTVSSYVEPQNLDIPTFMAGIESDMVMIKNGAGEIYWPALSINDIGDWNVRDGYKIFMNNPATLRISGTAVDPAQTPLDLPAGWNTVSYLRDTPLPVNEALSTVSSQLTLVKNGDGQVYWPAYGVNQIGDMQPGEGYQLYLHGQAALLYPAN